MSTILPKRTNTTTTIAAPSFDEKHSAWIEDINSSSVNPVIESAKFAYKKTNIVNLNEEGISIAARHIYTKLHAESYTPRTWRTHPLHILPTEPYTPSQWNKSVLNWIFLISSLNFSFWSEKEGRPDRYGVEWQEGWNADKNERKVWTGYWSLVAALNRALQDDNVPITDPHFYSSEVLCPDSVIESVFRAADQCREDIPLLQQRVAIMREVGFILCNSFGGSYLGFLEEFQRRHDGQGTALDLVKMITDTFPSFRDEVYLEDRKVYLWKRAQILVAETWAAFYPEPSTATTHPLFPGTRGPAIHELTMFADYRVPQILHHLKILTYPTSLIRKLRLGTTLEHGEKEEVSLRAASIVAVERVREEILRMIDSDGISEVRTDTETTVERGITESETKPNSTPLKPEAHLESRLGRGAETPTVVEGRSVSSVLIDFFLWDLAKRLERGEEKIEGIETADIIPAHRTRSIWY